MLKKILFLLMTLTLAMPATTSFAKHGGHEYLPGLEDKYFHKVNFLIGHRDDLGLTQEQVKSILDKHWDIKRVMTETSAQKDIALLDIYKQLHSDQPNVEEMNALVDKQLEAKKVYLRALVEALVYTINLLTPEQRAKAKELYLKEYYGKK